MSQKNTRELLGGIVTPANEKNWCDPDLFEKTILPIFPKEIKVVELPQKDLKKQYNCFAFVLGIEHIGYIYNEFMEKIIEQKELKETATPQKGDIVIYKNHNELMHAGLLKDKDKVVSKWSGGPLFEHNVFDVPDFYGNELKYYKSISKEAAKELFDKFKIFNRK